MLLDKLTACFSVIVLGMTPDNFLLVADPYQESLYQINLANDSIWKLPRIQHKFSHVAYDPVAEKVYWRVGDYTRRANLDGTTDEYFSGPCFISFV